MKFKDSVLTPEMLEFPGHMLPELNRKSQEPLYNSLGLSVLHMQNIASTLVKQVKKTECWLSATVWSVTKSFLCYLCDISWWLTQSNSNQSRLTRLTLKLWFFWMMTHSRQDLLQRLEASVAFQCVRQSLGSLHPYSVSTQTERMIQCLNVKCTHSGVQPWQQWIRSFRRLSYILIISDGTYVWKLSALDSRNAKWEWVLGQKLMSRPSCGFGCILPGWTS